MVDKIIKQKIAEQEKTRFMTLYQGYLQGVMKWADWDEFVETLQAQKEKDWFVYHVGEEPPEKAATSEQFATFVNEISTLLKKEHDEDYCGIVYTSDPKEPQLVKIYDPNNLGVVCGFSENPPLPGWVISLEKPDDLIMAFPPVQTRKRWWKKIFS